MSRTQKLTGYARYTWMTLGWNLLVILWGVFLRASKSGDGCGQHWLTCQGEVIPSAPQLKTIIEYSHRITSFLAFASIVGLLIWTFKKYGKGDPIRKTAVLSFIFVLTEALVGAGLVLTGNTAENLTPSRPFWMAGHLINTFVLLAFLTLTGYYASGGERLRWSISSKYKAAIVAGAVAVFIVGITGSVAALASMIFPSGSLSAGLAADLSPTSNMLVRLRLLHPITAIAAGVALIFIAGSLGKEAGIGTKAKRWANVHSLFILGQLLFGAATLLMLAPIVMQLGHLLLVDLIWISFVMMTANFLSREPLS
ncbi:MAG: COX15/CtaA family protein [Pyrinomonadaceae bacterium]